MIKAVFDKICKDKKIDPNNVEYALGFESGSFIKVVFGVRCATGTASPMVVAEVKLRMSSIIKQWENGGYDWNDYLTEGWENKSYMH